ncbi:MAG TPA: hypothetical protein DDY68_04955 [Porphyromonadaceae bacterium]|nr:hypothetical protein [Porphyromonadaceae bacterium]
MDEIRGWLILGLVLIYFCKQFWVKFVPKSKDNAPEPYSIPQEEEELYEMMEEENKEKPILNGDNYIQSIEKPLQNTLKNRICTPYEENMMNEKGEHIQQEERTHSILQMENMEDWRKAVLYSEILNRKY